MMGEVILDECCLVASHGTLVPKKGKGGREKSSCPPFRESFQMRENFCQRSHPESLCD